MADSTTSEAANAEHLMKRRLQNRESQRRYRKYESCGCLMVYDRTETYDMISGNKMRVKKTKAQEVSVSTSLPSILPERIRTLSSYSTLPDGSGETSDYFMDLHKSLSWPSDDASDTLFDQICVSVPASKCSVSLREQENGAWSHSHEDQDVTAVLPKQPNSRMTSNSRRLVERRLDRDPQVGISDNSTDKESSYINSVDRASLRHQGSQADPYKQSLFLDLEGGPNAIFSTPTFLEAYRSDVCVHATLLSCFYIYLRLTRLPQLAHHHW
jgi:hypothetical protein